MAGRIVDLSERSRDSGNANHGTGTVPANVTARKANQIRPVHDWDADAVTMLTIEPGTIPNVACVRLTIMVDAFQRSYEVSIAREDWRRSLVLQGRRHPSETPEQAQRREGVLLFLNELLSASYGVPA